MNSDGSWADVHGNSFTKPTPEDFAHWDKMTVEEIAAEFKDKKMTEIFYIDCEFDGHDGELLSIAAVTNQGRSIHIRVVDVIPSDPWVIENVMPIMDKHHAYQAHFTLLKEVGASLREFIGDREEVLIVADSPVDIGRFCRAISTGADGKWISADYKTMRFEVYNVDCYPTTVPGAIQHNAYWDAMALKEKIGDNLWDGKTPLQRMTYR